MCALLVQQGLSKALKCKKVLPTIMFDEETDEPVEKAHSNILLCSGNEVLLKVVEEDTIVKLWLNLKSLYMTKSLKNHLYLKEVIVYFLVDKRMYVH